MFFPKDRIVILVGHYGSGKSELAINLALLMSQSGETKEGNSLVWEKTYLADLDIVNPYFRSREKADFLLSKNIDVICSAEDFPGVDLPYMPENLRVLFDNPKVCGVIDAGGDPAGAKVLARYAEEIKKGGLPVYCVINANRPLTKTSGDAIRYIGEIQAAANLKISGLINNTHLLGETVEEDVLRGAELVNEISRETGIPIVAHTASESIASELQGKLNPILPIEIYLRKPWEI